MRTFIIVSFVATCSMAVAQPRSSPPEQSTGDPRGVAQLRAEVDALRTARVRVGTGFVFSIFSIALSNTGFVLTDSYVHPAAAWSMGVAGLVGAIVLTAVGLGGAVRLRRAHRAIWPSEPRPPPVLDPPTATGTRLRKAFGWSLGFASVGASLTGWWIGIYECFDDDDCSPSVWPWAMAVGGIVLAPIMFALGIGGTIRSRRARHRRVQPHGLGFRF